MFFTIAIVGAIFLIASVGIAAWFYEPQDDHTDRPTVQVVDQIRASEFFTDAPRPRALASDVPISLLLAHLEQHIRYEEAAAEAFLQAPERATLYTQTHSTWVN